jgi:hypothetical protein
MVKFCGLKCKEDINQTLATLWIANLNDLDAEKEFVLRPEITVEDCYQLAKGLEQMQLGQPLGHVNVVRQSNYKQGSLEEEEEEVVAETPPPMPTLATATRYRTAAAAPTVVS